MVDIKVIDHNDVVKDGVTGAVLATPEALKIYRENKIKKLRERDREREFQTLKNEVKDLKSLVIQLMDRIDRLYK